MGIFSAFKEASLTITRNKKVQKTAVFIASLAVFAFGLGSSVSAAPNNDAHSPIPPTKFRLETKAIQDVQKKVEAEQERVKKIAFENAVFEKAAPLITHFEGDKLKAYMDVKGPAIGRGHTDGVYMGMKITQEQSDAFLRSDMRNSLNHVLALLPNKDVSVDEAVPYVCAVFNLGNQFDHNFKAFNEGRMTEEQLLAKLALYKKAENPRTGLLEILEGLEKRRNEECALLAKAYFAKKTPFQGEYARLQLALDKKDAQTTVSTNVTAPSNLTGLFAAIDGFIQNTSIFPAPIQKIVNDVVALSPAKAVLNAEQLIAAFDRTNPNSATHLGQPQKPKQITNTKYFVPQWKQALREANRAHIPA